VSFANCVITRSAFPNRNCTFIGGALDVLRDDHIRTLLTDADDARQIKLAAHGHAAVGKIDVWDRGVAHADVHQRDDLLDLREKRGLERRRWEAQAGAGN
jgi:hypothetical protein